jgi:O-antigen/teichoic acid export membrane protein
MNHLRNTVIGVGFAYLQIAVTLAQGLIITPMCLMHVPDATFGAWLVAGNLLAWIGLLDPGFHVVIQQRIAAAHAVGDMSTINRLRLQAYVISALLACVAMMGAVLVMPLYSIIVHRLGCDQPGPASSAYLLASLATALFVASYGAAVVTVGRQSPAVHGFIGFFGQMCHVVVVVACLKNGLGIPSLPLGLLTQAIVILVGNLAYASLTMPPMAWRDSAGLDGVGLLLRDTRGVFMGRAGAAVAANSDMLIASWFLGASSAVGLNVTQRAPLILRMLTERVSHAAMPVLSSINAAERGVEPAAASAAVVRAAMWMAIPFATAILLWNGTFVSLWVGKDYYSGHAVNQLIAVGFVAATLEATLINVCTALGLYAASGRLLLVKSVLSLGIGTLGAWLYGVGGLLAAPLIAGGLTTWWLLPRVISGHSNWSEDRWRALIVDTMKGCGAAAAVAIAVSMIELRDVGMLVIASLVYILGYAACLAWLSSEFRSLLGVKQLWITLRARHPS